MHFLDSAHKWYHTVFVFLGIFSLGWCPQRKCTANKDTKAKPRKSKGNFLFGGCQGFPAWWLRCTRRPSWWELFRAWMQHVGPPRVSYGRAGGESQALGVLGEHHRALQGTQPLQGELGKLLTCGRQSVAPPWRQNHGTDFIILLFICLMNGYWKFFWSENN